MRRFKHKQTKIIGELKDGYLDLDDGESIPQQFILNGDDWIEIKEESCFSKTVSIQREKDGVMFTIGDTVKVDDSKAHFNHIITGFINHTLKDKCFTCITTKEKNGFGEELINIDIIKQVKETGWMTKQCLSIQDYVDVLNENKKAFLFEATMIAYLKEKVQ